jgi:hypothetical protein
VPSWPMVPITRLSADADGHGPAGGSHPEQPEHRRQLVIGISGRVEVTATGVRGGR